MPLREEAKGQSVDEVIQQLGSRDVIKDVNCFLSENQPQNVPPGKAKGGLQGLFNSIAKKVTAPTEEEKDRYTRIEQGILAYSNDDIMTARPGCLIRKVWRITNVSGSKFPSDTRIVSVTKGLQFEYPTIQPQKLGHGHSIDLSMKMYIPENEPLEPSIKQYILRLFCDEYQVFGEPIIFTVMFDIDGFEHMKISSAQNFSLDDNLK